MGYGDSYRVPHGGPCGGPTGIPAGFPWGYHGVLMAFPWPPWIIQILGLARIFEYPGRVGSAWNNTNIGLGLNIRIVGVFGFPPGIQIGWHLCLDIRIVRVFGFPPGMQNWLVFVSGYTNSAGVWVPIRNPNWLVFVFGYANSAGVWVPTRNKNWWVFVFGYANTAGCWVPPPGSDEI